MTETYIPKTLAGWASLVSSDAERFTGEALLMFLRCMRTSDFISIDRYYSEEFGWHTLSISKRDEGTVVFIIQPYTSQGQIVEHNLDAAGLLNLLKVMTEVLKRDYRMTVTVSTQSQLGNGTTVAFEVNSGVIHDKVISLVQNGKGPESEG